MNGHFSQTYAEARAKFIGTCASADARLTSHRNDRAMAPDGNPLYVDVARFGPSDPKALLILNSGTHGVEGYCGSACEIAVVRSGLASVIPDHVAMVMVHAINPYGFAHDRRVNEDNVDLNRNFVDHDRPPADPDDYETLHEALVPESWTGPARERADQRLRDYIRTNGWPAYQKAVTAGQYRHPDGLFYGGTRPVWSNLAWRSILEMHAGQAEQIAFIDFHTGLGPEGAGEVIFVGADPTRLARARSWYGEVTSTVEGSSSSAEVRGDLARAFDDAAPFAELTPIALEFGTVPLAAMLEAVRADNWLHSRGDASSPEREAIKGSIRSAFYVEDDKWKAAVTGRALEVVTAALKGLGDDH